MSWAGMSGGLLVLEQLGAQHLQLPLSRLRDRLIVRPLAYGAASDAEQVCQLTIGQAQTLSELCFRHVHGAQFTPLSCGVKPAQRYRLAGSAKSA